MTARALTTSSPMCYLERICGQCALWCHQWPDESLRGISGAFVILASVNLFAVSSSVNLFCSDMSSQVFPPWRASCCCFSHLLSSPRHPWRHVQKKMGRDPMQPNVVKVICCASIRFRESGALELCATGLLRGRARTCTNQASPRVSKSRCLPLFAHFNFALKKKHSLNIPDDDVGKFSRRES